MQRKYLILLVILSIIFLVFPLNQRLIVGKDIKNACSGLAGFGFRKVRYAAVSNSEWESLAHYETWCLFWIDLGK